MTCYRCRVDTPLTEWHGIVFPCISNSCSEDQGRECPVCGFRASHLWLDVQPEWRASEFYRP